MAFLCPVIAGVAFMAYGGAPPSYMYANIGATGMIGAAFWLAPQVDQRSALLAVTMAVPVLLMSTFAGPAINDVHRWIAIGPIKLHAAMLVLPFFATQMPRHDKRVVTAIVSLAALLIALQPDRASAFALFLMALCWLCIARHRWAITAFVASSAALVTTMLDADKLRPVRFVENVVGDAAAGHPGIAALLAGTMMLAIGAPVYSSWRGAGSRTAGFVLWSACLTGYYLAALVGSYPVPLLGYGLSPILGFGLALAFLTRESDEVV